MLACVAVVLIGLSFLKGRSTQARVEASRRHTIHLEWQPPAKSRKPVAGYNIYRSNDGGGSFSKLNTLPIPKSEYDDATVRRGTAYLYIVKSVGKKGVESGPSNEIRMAVP
jgi:fibronectin type 3 domain-containing protein